MAILRSFAQTNKVTFEQEITEADSTDWVKLSGFIQVQINGTASTITAALQRSPVYPGSDGSSAVIATIGSSITGDTNDGLIASTTESGVAWYRVDVSAIEASETATVYITGTEG